MLDTHYPTADSGHCGLILDKIDFLLKVQQVADGVDQIEPLLEDLADQIRVGEGCRQQISERFFVLMQNIDVWSLEIMQYCMYELRWPEVADRAEMFLRQEGRVGPHRLYERLLESFADDWPEREFFRRYSN